MPSMGLGVWGHAQRLIPCASRKAIAEAFVLMSAPVAPIAFAMFFACCAFTEDLALDC